MIKKNLIINSKLIISSLGNSGEGVFSIETNSRLVKPGQCFIAIKGEKFDAYKFKDEVLAKGAKLFIYNHDMQREAEIKSLQKNFPDTLFLGVTDTIRFLQETANNRLNNWKEQNPENKVIGITGSNGKTTHKEILYQYLDHLKPEKVHFTKGNFNNHLGVPLTLLELEDHHEIAIIEMGSNHPGEIKFLCDIASPEHGIITSIGSAHIEFFKTIENIFTEKSSLYKSVLENKKGQGNFVANFDDLFLVKLENSVGLTSFSTETEKADFKLTLKNELIELQSSAHHFKLKNSFIKEDFNQKNLVACFLLALKLFPEGAEDLVSFTPKISLPKNNRSQWIDIDNKQIFLDAYNANPTSMEASLKSFAKNIIKQSGTCLVILGDMNELGEDAKVYHQKTSSLLNKLGFKKALFIGKFKDEYLKSFQGEAWGFSTVNEAKEKFKSLYTGADFIFVKGSRSLQLESLIDIK